MTKLITVTVSFEFVVAADDATPEDEYEYIARDYITDAARDLTSSQFDIATRPYKAGDVSEWDEACLPYGGDGNSTTADYLKAA